MKVLIIGIGRTGTSSLLDGIAEQFDVRISEPFYHRWREVGHHKNFEWPMKELQGEKKVVLKCLINQTPFTLKIENESPEMIQFYVDWSKDFDKVILLGRKNIKEHWESWLNLMYRFYQTNKEYWPGDRSKEAKWIANTHEKWYWEAIPQDFIDTQTSIKHKFEEQHESLKKVSESLNIPITYYEDLYGEDRMESFEVINKWELDLDPFQLNEYLHPSNRYRQFGDRNPI